MKIYESAVRKPISTILLFVGVMVFGLFSLMNLAVDQYPEIEIPQISVITMYPGAIAADIETNITRVLEDNLNTVSNLKKLTSKSQDNVSMITVEFEYGSDLNEGANEIRDVVSRVQSQLPDDIDYPTIFKFSTSMIPVMMIAVTAEESYPALNKILDDKLVNVLNRVDGVGAVSIIGAPEREVQVNVDPAKLEAYNLTVEQLGQIIAAENVNIPSGTIDVGNNTITIKAGERAANVRIRGNYAAIAATDSLGLTLRLLTQQADQWDLYEKSYEAKVILQKCCPFDINLFNGYAVLTSTYMQEFMPNVDNRLIKAIIDPEEENTIIMKDFFYDGYNVKIRFTTNDILNPLIEMDEQTFASTAEAFGTNYGDGYLHLYQSSSGVSYYSTCEQFIFQYFTLYVPGMAGNNVVGTFASAIEWISNDEAKRLYLEGSMLVSETVKTDFEKK